MPNCCNLQTLSHHFLPLRVHFQCFQKPGFLLILFWSHKIKCVFPARLRSMLKQLEEKDVDFEEIKKSLDFTASLLEAVYLDGTR